MNRTRWNPGYLPPSAMRVRRMADKMEVDTRSIDAVQDLAALLAGEASPLEATALQKNVKQAARSRPLRALESGKYMVRETGQVFENPKNAIQHQEKMLYDYHLGMRDFLLRASAAPPLEGDSPLETALLTFKAMKESLPTWNPTMEDSEVDEMKLFGGFANPFMSEQMHKEMKTRFSAMKTLDRWERTMLLGASLYTEETEKEVDPCSEDPELQIEIAKVMNYDIREALRVSRNISQLSNMNNPAMQRWQAQPDGDETAYRSMKSLSEISHMRTSSYALKKTQPKLFTHKLVNGHFTVREHGINRDRRQLLYMLIDGSGSMGGARAAMATGVLLNRLRNVVKGDAKLWFAMFDGEPRHERSACTPMEAFEAVKYVMDGNTYSGGSTNIDGAIYYAVQQINQKREEDPDLILPELVLVSDGEACCKTTREDLGEIRFHVIQCATGLQKDLRKLAQSTRGVYTHID